MKEFDLALQILDDVLDNDTPFNEALRKIFQSDASLRPLRGTVAGLVGCELRHHILFGYLTRPLESYSDEEKRILSLALSDLYFSKRLKQEDLMDILKVRVGEDKLLEASALLEKAKTNGPFIPENVEPRSRLYLSLRFNTPEWVLKILIHFGYGNTYKVLKKNSKPYQSTVRLRTSAMSRDEFTSSTHEYGATNTEDIYSYLGKASLQKSELYKNMTIFKEKALTKKIIDKYRVNDPEQLFIYATNPDSSILKEAIESYGPNVAMNLGVRKIDGYGDVTRLIRMKGLKNVNFFESELDVLEASISKPQDLVIVNPLSSNLDLIREQPDYLLHFKKEEMDRIFDDEKKALEACSKYVEEGGKLIYMIYTISQKEGISTINAFLANHPEFKMVEQRQAFPFEEEETSMYYAVMEKDTDLAKAEPPVGTIIAKEPEPTLMSASGK